MPATTPNLNLVNSKCSVYYLPDRRQVGGTCFQDQNNYPAFYNQTSRGLPKAWEALCAAFTDETGMYDVARILRDNGIRIHSYCSMD